MDLDALPDEVTSFIAEHVPSLMALELLLLLQSARTREWTEQELGRELRSGADWAGRELQELARHGLVAASQEQPPRYRYAPAKPELDSAVMKLAALYPARRFSIIQLIYAPPRESIEKFADAFKLRKDPTDG